MCARLCVHDISSALLCFFAISSADSAPHISFAPHSFLVGSPSALHFTLHDGHIPFSFLVSILCSTVLQSTNTMLTTCNIHRQRPGRQLDLRRRQHAHPDPRDDDGPPHRGQGAERRVHRECPFIPFLTRTRALFCPCPCFRFHFLRPRCLCSRPDLLFRGFASSFRSPHPVSPPVFRKTFAPP